MADYNRDPDDFDIMHEFDDIEEEDRELERQREEALELVEELGYKINRLKDNVNDALTSDEVEEIKNRLDDIKFDELPY